MLILFDEYCNCENCALYEFCGGVDTTDVEGCELFESSEYYWSEMSYHKFAPKTMQQRLRDGE